MSLFHETAWRFSTKEQTSTKLKVRQDLVFLQAQGSWILVVSIGLFWFYFVSFSYNGVCILWLGFNCMLIQYQRRALILSKILMSNWLLEDRFKMYFNQKIHFVCSLENDMRVQSISNSILFGLLCRRSTSTQTKPIITFSPFISICVLFWCQKMKNGLKKHFTRKLVDNHAGHAYHPSIMSCHPPLLNPSPILR